MCYGSVSFFPGCAFVSMLGFEFESLFTLCIREKNSKFTGCNCIDTYSYIGI